jgi:tartrate-resistant acid phosphatase type 5
MVKKHIVLIVIWCFLFVNIVNAQKFVIISDIHGSTPDTYSVSELVKSWQPDFIITAGDNHYGSSAIYTIDDQVGQYYSDFIFPYTGSYGTGDTVNRFFPCLGNHDNDGNGLVNFLQYFQLPGNERYYDFVRGNVHFFAINCNLSEPDGVTDTSIQAIWLKNQLAFSTSLYNVIFFHMPAYTSGYHGSTTYMRWPFKQWGASIVFSGHDHDYERLNIDSFPYIVCGLGGGTLYTVYNPLVGSQFSDVLDHGAILASANIDSMYFEFRNTSDSLIDHFTVLKRSMSVVNSTLSNNEPVLFQNYPNPILYDGSVIKFYLPNDGIVSMTAYSIIGDSFEIISNKKMSAGFNEIKWNTENLKSGIYYYSLHFNDYVKISEAIIL